MTRDGLVGFLGFLNTTNIFMGYVCLYARISLCYLEEFWTAFNLYVLVNTRLKQYLAYSAFVCIVKTFGPFYSQKYMPGRKTGEEMNFTYVECLLYTFHHLAHKVSILVAVIFVPVLVRKL